ncbi:MAG: hypothetical protein ACOYKZ_07865 [Chlamydiia bacterium]
MPRAFLKKGLLLNNIGIFMNLKKTALSLLSLLAIATTGFSDDLTLDNQTMHPAKDQKSKIAIQWATSGKDVDDGNHAMLHGLALNQASIQVLGQSGTVNLTIPDKAEYLRVLVWSTGEGDPDLLTNWVDIVPNKTYTLKPDHLVPSVLMAGTGC